MDAIRTDALTKHYTVGFWRPRPYVALDSLTLQVGQGEVFGFLGPNGAGKTTTLKLLMQLIFPTSGRAEILGRPAGDVGIRRRIGYLPENPYFYDYLTAEELLRYFAAVLGIPSADRGTRVSQLLDEVGIFGERRLQLRKYSKGMLQRVGIAQALLNEPDVVFFDEPMSGLDPLGRRGVRSLILRLRERGCTVFFSSHVLADAEALCTRVAIMAAGRLVAVDTLADAKALATRGWELVIGEASGDLMQQLQERGAIVRATGLGAGRWTIELPATTAPEILLPELAARGVKIVSLQPLRDSLEDLFVRQVGSAAGRAGFERP